MSSGWRQVVLTWGLGILIMLVMILAPVLIFGFFAVHGISVPLPVDNR